ncbi:collagen alpha-6(VI) chain-like [Saccostrea echinata]|uniref:collagen alpha-6(VI) chain-like n=1 Tax=Saccostrea echinata TaxID=191078 RepID=UPI002A834EFE|nr:collagen alpha-6(VI) chain-like [Saccostrea echinata]
MSTGCESLQCTNSPVDLVFVIDSSSSIFPNEFIRQLEFLENITGELDVGPAVNQSRVGVISFSDEPRLEFTLNNCTEKKDILAAVRRINYMSGGTNTASAIRLAVKMFKAATGARKGAKDIIVVITDGESFSKSETEESALQARNMGISMFAIGVGANVNVEELSLIAGITEHVYRVSNYGDLKSIKEALINKTCIEIHQSTTTTSLEEDMPLNETVNIENCSGKPADVLFLLDSSSSISRDDFKKQLTCSFIKSIVSAFDINPHKTAVGVSTFSDDFQSVFHLNEFTSKESIFKAVDNVPYLRGGTDTGNALKNIIDYGFKFARPDVVHILIVITDGLSRDPFETFLEANKLKKTGGFIFAIGVGPFVDKKELKAMASPPQKDLNFVFNVSTYDALHSIKNLLAIKTCVIAGLHMEDRPICIMDKPVDILFTFNAASVGYQGTRSILKTIQNFEKLRFQNESDIRIGVISQSCVYGGDLPLQSPNKYLAISFDKMSFLIKRVRSYGLTEENGVRSEAVHIAVLIVDKLLTREDELEILELENMINKMYIAYLGNSHNKNSILKISSTSVKTLSLADFTAIESLSGYLQEEICQMTYNN